MATYRLSRAAEADIDTLYEYSIRTFGLVTARAYLDGLFERFDLIARQPRLGRVLNDLVPGLGRPDVRRHEHISHSIYYGVDEDGGVLIVRILGALQDAARHIL